MPRNYTFRHFIKPKQLDSMPFCDLMDYLLIAGSAELSDITGCSQRTCERWIKNNDAPIMARRLLSTSCRGLPHMLGWEKMYIGRDGRLVNEMGHCFTAGDINAMSVQLCLLSDLKSENKRLKLELDDRAQEGNVIYGRFGTVVPESA